MKHILMIDDVTTNLKCAAEVLKKKYKLSTAKSGEKALEFLSHTKPDMILLDINMPDMNGYELLEILKKEKSYVDIPIIFLTAESDMESEAKGLKMGAMDYIRKPFDPDVLLSRVAKVMQMHETKKTLETMANKDSLTTLWNRRYMEEYVEKGNPKDGKGVFMLLDMDNFKSVNDNFGHLMGDNVLVAFAKTLRESAGEENSVCRIGGDEFVVFLNDDYSEAKIREIARNLIASIEFEINKMLDFEEELKISVSIGIAMKPEDGKDFKTLYNNADKALYFVKRNGKRGYHFYHEYNNSVQSINSENNLIDLMHLQMLIQETDSSNGAYRVEYGGFKRIYRFVARCVERSKQDVQIVLFSASAEEYKEGSQQNEEVTLRMEKTMQELEEAITASLRRGDVATKFSASQYVVILMDASLDNGKRVVERILNKYQKKKSHSEYVITYDIQSVNKLP